MARILVIDDDTSLLQMMSMMLKRAGHEPILVSDGQEGIFIAREEHPDLAVVDIMMPDLSGHEVCRRLRQEPATADIPLLVLTALPQFRERDLAAEAGADDFVRKPVTRDDLVSRVEELLASGPRNTPMPVEDAAGWPSTHSVVPPIEGVLEDGQAIADVLKRRPAQPAPEERPRYPLTVVTGVRSGVGATTLAVNVALMLARRARTCLVELHPCGGRAALQMQMKTRPVSWHNLVDLPPGGDKWRVGTALTFDQNRGLALLASPREPVDVLLSAEQLEYIVSVLCEAFPHIVATLPPELNGMAVDALCLAEHVVLVVGEDPRDLPGVPERLQRLEALGLRGEVLVVLNQTRPYGVSHDEVVAAINRPLAASVPYEPAHMRALGEEEPLVLSRPDLLFSQSIAGLVRRL